MDKFSERVEKSMFHEYPEGGSRGPFITQTTLNRRETRNYARVKVNKQILCSIMIPELEEHACRIDTKKKLK